MDTLSLVSKYLNGMKDILDDGDSLEARKLTIEKSKEKLELFEALDHKSVIVNDGSHKVVVFKKAPPHAYSKPFTRFSLPCDVDGQGAWDAKLDMADSFNYMTEERFDQLGFVRVDYGKYGRKMAREVRVEIHGFTFLVDFVVIDYANEGEPSVIFGRDFLVTSMSRVDFGIGEMRIDLNMLEEMKDIDVILDKLVENLEEVEIPPISTIAPPSPIHHPLTQKQKEKVKEALDRKYKELEESKPILEVLENYMTYRKKLDEVLMGRARLSRYDYGEEVKMRIVEHGLPKKMCDPGNFVLPVKVNGTIEMNALANTGANVSVLPYCLFMNLGLVDPKPYKSNLTMADNTQAKAMGEFKNVRIQIGYQAYLVDFLILYIAVDKELPLLLGRLFFRTCGAVIDMRRDTLCIDDGVIRHTYFPKPRAKAYLDNFMQEEEDDWLSCFKVGRDEDGNPKYGLVAPLFLDIEDDMERALAMEAYFNPFKNIIVFKKLIDFLGSFLVQLKNTDLGNEGYGTYKKVEGDEAWHAKFEVTTPSGRKFTRMFKTKKINRKLFGKFISEYILKFDQFLD
ncbi:putative ribonuclease H-like domain-containing protein [Tanacetum coccineum]|uniref:Ribonuclease H-like domain-containing protein n=1 Tax=Tanacetum coccineum TaxID=301880 RepID=A0ABQ5GQH3_9ASTR